MSGRRRRSRSGSRERVERRYRSRSRERDRDRRRYRSRSRERRRNRDNSEHVRKNSQKEDVPVKRRRLEGVGGRRMREMDEKRYAREQNSTRLEDMQSSGMDEFEMMKKLGFATEFGSTKGVKVNDHTSNLDFAKVEGKQRSRQYMNRHKSKHSKALDPVRGHIPTDPKISCKNIQ